MKTYYYNLDTQQAKHFAGLKTGEKMVLVVPLKEQPLEGYKLHCPLPYGNLWWIFSNDFSTDSPEYIEIKIRTSYPLNARVGLREAWNYSFDMMGEPIKPFIYKASTEFAEFFIWRSSQCMSREAVRFWGIVEDVRVDRAQKITYKELMSAGCREDERTEDWFNRRYKGKWTWEQNPYCEIMTMKKDV